MRTRIICQARAGFSGPTCWRPCSGRPRAESTAWCGTRSDSEHISRDSESNATGPGSLLWTFAGDTQSNISSPFKTRGVLRVRVLVGDLALNQMVSRKKPKRAKVVMGMNLGPWQRHLRRVGGGSWLRVPQCRSSESRPAIPRAQGEQRRWSAGVPQALHIRHFFFFFSCRKRKRKRLFDVRAQ